MRSPDRRLRPSRPYPGSRIDAGPVPDEAVGIGGKAGCGGFGQLAQVVLRQVERGGVEVGVQLPDRARAKEDGRDARPRQRQSQRDLRLRTAVPPGAAGSRRRRATSARRPPPSGGGCALGHALFVRHTHCYGRTEDGARLREDLQPVEATIVRATVPTRAGAPLAAAT